MTGLRSYRGGQVLVFTTSELVAVSAWDDANNNLRVYLTVEEAAALVAALETAIANLPNGGSQAFPLPPTAHLRLETAEAEVVRLREALTVHERVAHAAWHLLDDSGAQEGTDDIAHYASDHQRLSDALDVLDATGWDAHPDEETP